ncbi:MAG: ABC transporter ATP-binding protein [Lachnospiraceae bacterium]|nr:ABC transporter ATP-binding protein [Lachnospiraceae bacterium]
MRNIWQKLNLLLDKKQKRNMAGILVMMVIGAFLEMASVALLVANVKQITQPEEALEDRVIGTIYRMAGSPDFKIFSAMVMGALILSFIIKNSYLYLERKAMLAFVYTNQFRTSERMMRNYIRRSYEFYLNADTAVVQRNITSDVNNMYALILALLQLASDGCVSLAVITYCFVQNGEMTILMAIVMAILLLVVKKVLKPTLLKAGKDNQHYYSGLYKCISQMVHGIKDIKVSGNEKYFVTQYKECGKGYVDAVQKYSLYNSVPKLLIETVCVAAMMLYVIVEVLSGTSAESLTVSLGALGAAALVLLPAVNRINNQITTITYLEPFFLDVADNLKNEIEGSKIEITDFEKPVEKMTVEKSITLQDVTYAYPHTDKLIFDHVNLEIPIGKSIGIVGTTGAGKSTVVDIVLGLLELKGGQVLVDGQDIKDNYRGWLKNVGYIPQMSYMLDESIRKNVAFGVAEAEIDDKRVWEVLGEAQLDEFVKTLPEGLDTKIGERGIRLSGGQRQRISIARALYEDPKILIMDEATSAVDNDTEAAIMESINRFQGKKTMLIIAHRLQTIEKCDMVYRVEGGKVMRER